MTQNNKPTKYERDLALVESILAKGDAMTHFDRVQLLTVYNVSWHDSGKIEGTFSLDSSCNGCTFCSKMRAAAEKDPTIICGKCYDHKQEEYRTNVKLRHTLNMRIMSSVEFTLDEMAMLPSSLVVRINSSGDIENATHARNMIRYAMTHAAANVGLWGKNRPAIEEAFDELGKPANVVYVASSIHVNKPDALPKYADYTFTVYDKDHIAEAIANGACSCNGAKCMTCGYKCYFGTWPKGSDIAELLR